MGGGGRGRSFSGSNSKNKSKSKGRKGSKIPSSSSLFVEGGALADWRISSSCPSSIPGRNPGGNSKRGVKLGSSDNDQSKAAASASRNGPPPRSSRRNVYGYNYPSVQLREGLVVADNDRDKDLDTQPIVLGASKETQIIAYFDETPSSKFNNTDFTYDYAPSFVLGESSHRGLGFHDESEATPGGLESFSKELEMEEQNELGFDSFSSDDNMNDDENMNCEVVEEITKEIPTKVISQKKNSGFLSIAGMKVYTEDISDGESDGDDGGDYLDDASESSDIGQPVDFSESDLSEDTSDSESDIDDEVAEDYLAGICGSDSALDAKWLAEQDLGDSDEDSSSSECLDDTVDKFGGIALQEASRMYGMKPKSSKKYIAHNRPVLPSDLDDLMLVKDPRVFSTKKKHVSRLPQSWPSVAQKNKSSRRLPGEKKKHRKELMAVKRRDRMMNRGVNIRKINAKLEKIVLNQVEVSSFQPMHPRDCSQVRRLAAIYRLHSECQGSGKKRFVTVSRTQHTSMPSASDRLRLNKLIGDDKEDADFSANQGSKTRSVKSTDRNRMKNMTEGSGRKNESYAKVPVSFISSGTMQPNTDETTTVVPKETIETSGSKFVISSVEVGSFELHTKGFGSKMMAKMGFVEGGGLGKDGQGMAKPIEVVQRPKSLGLGVDFSSPIDDSIGNRTPQTAGSGRNRTPQTGNERNRTPQTGSGSGRNRTPQSGSGRNRTPQTGSGNGGGRNRTPQTGSGRSGNDTNPQNLGSFERHTKGFGSKMMARMGFVEGTGLGRDSQGMVNPLVAVRRPKARGLGAEVRY